MTGVVDDIALRAHRMDVQTGAGRECIVTFDLITEQGPVRSPEQVEQAHGLATRTECRSVGSAIPGENPVLAPGLLECQRRLGITNIELMHLASASPVAVLLAPEKSGRQTEHLRCYGPALFFVGVQQRSRRAAQRGGQFPA